MKNRIAGMAHVCLTVAVLAACHGAHGQGSTHAWGYNAYGQCDVPAPNTDFVAIAAGEYHSLGLKTDGRIVAWGNNWSGQCNVPAPNTDFVAVAAGELHSLGLKGYSHALGDLNCDGALDAFDIDPFVVCLTTGICECP